MRWTRSSSVAHAVPALVCCGVGLLITFSACSATTRFRVLSFFLDGVPDPNARPVAVVPLGGNGVPKTSSTEQPRINSRIISRYYAHTPYRDNRCGGCHSIETGQLVRTIEDGLCVTCHSQLVRGERFVHGPVAVNDCTVCHHHHTAPYPNLLLAPETETCLACHAADDLADGDYHATIGERTCTACHDPHGGRDRFFLRTERGTP